MNKQQLVQEVATRLDISKARAERAVDATLESIGHGLTEDGTVRLAHFGSFARATRAGRTIRNPATGEPMEIPPKTVVKFKPSDYLNGLV